MKIKAKLAIGLSLLLLLMIGITSFSYERLSQMNRSINLFYDDRFEKVRLALAVRGEINAAARIVNDMILGGEKARPDADEMNDLLKSAWLQIDALSHKKLDDVEQTEMNALSMKAQAYSALLNQFLALAGDRRTEYAKQPYMDKLRDSQRDLIDAVDGMVKLQEDTSRAEMEGAKKIYSRSVRIVATMILFGVLLGIAIVFWIFPSITSGLNLLERMAVRFSKGRLRSFSRFEVSSKDELGELARLFQRIALDLHLKNEQEKQLFAVQRRLSRMNGQIARVTELLQAGSDAKAAAQLFISEFAPALGAHYGVVYIGDPLTSGAILELSGVYAAPGREEEAGSPPPFLRSGEGLAGQSYRDRKAIFLTDVPDGYAKVSSGLGSAKPRSLLVQPISNGRSAIGVIELASLSEFGQDDRELLAQLCDKLGAILETMVSRRRVETLLRESQAMTQELQAQSEELRETNDKLAAHHRQLAQANAELERQAGQLEHASKIKSEFLANLSHELRTPLNSLIVLSDFLLENPEGNLTDKQRGHVGTIQASGVDLLKMIDEILDLSKMDAGKMELNPEWLVLEDTLSFLRSLFEPMAENKKLSLSLGRDDRMPEAIWTDGHRIQQILRNLLSNAIKFTDEGAVEVRIRRPDESEMLAGKAEAGEAYVALSVADTGIGVPEDKRELIFEAFRQADGTTSRKYGGTGLGLTISRELAKLLGGWIHYARRPGGGSAFTLVVPERLWGKTDFGH